MQISAGDVNDVRQKGSEPYKSLINFHAEVGKAKYLYWATLTICIVAFSWILLN